MGCPAKSYREFARCRSQANPCVTPLVEHLGRGPGTPSTIIVLDYSRNGPLTPTSRSVAEAELANLLNATSASAIQGRVLLVENIRPNLISLLGALLDIDPVFFAGHIATDYGDIEKAPAPPSIALFPSQIAERGYLHLHFQRVFDMGTSEDFKGAAYALKTESNTPRNIRLLPPLSGRQLALARANCSILLKQIRDSWICLILVDPPTTTIVEKGQGSGGRKGYPSEPLHGGFEDFAQRASFTSFTSTPNDPLLWNKRSMLNSLLYYFRHQPPGFSTTAQPSILSLGYYPTRVALAEWVIYIHLLSRYFKYYEYSLHDIQTRLHDSDIVDLQRWRRRCMQSRRKLRLLRAFIEHWLPHEADKQPWDLVLRDVDDVLWHLEHYSRSLEQMIPVATSMVQLHDSQHAMLETANVSRLTFIALVFVPLSWVASLFSMSDHYSPGGERFWVYFATALPVLVVVLLLSALQWGQLAEKLKGTRRLLRERVRGQKTGGRLP
ncbi:zinc transport protein ZntB [Achaetomium macrosporum]|uniref:Zinc transport protein ZntB n=1 Tax=Achaetomium macrosporum TaxID=79813 RepID=A0AAN7C1H0_9PEZI|nr:zinc transport protein ZntB [Achaetomium macrosporum]